MGLKTLLKQIFPMSASSMQYELSQLLLQIQKISDLQEKLLQTTQALLSYSKTLEEQETRLNSLIELQKSEIVLFKKLIQHQDELFQKYQNTTDKLLEKNVEIADLQKSLQKTSRNAERASLEEVWAHVFNNTVSGSDWLRNKSFSPGRWAVGYPYLYAMYRVLNEIHPKHILELGLGQSTRMISQYASFFCDITHMVIEQDPRWIEFFKRDFKLPPTSQIIQLNYDFVPYKDTKKVRVYQNFQESVAGSTYDFISIDAPLGGDMKEYARIDILSLIPQHLDKDFIIMIGDTNRSGEKHTVNEIEECLGRNGIEYQCGKYLGIKECTLLCSKSLGFLRSM